MKWMAALLAAFLLCSVAYGESTVYEETITPNKLEISWTNLSRPKVYLESFRIRGYNVAQLRTLAGACGGSVYSRGDGTYQISNAAVANEWHLPISFASESRVKVKYNVTRIRDLQGYLLTPGQPGWVYLVDYNYNWGSLRDILSIMGLNIAYFDDNPSAAWTSVIIVDPRTPQMTATPTPYPTWYYPYRTPAPDFWPYLPRRERCNLGSRSYRSVYRELEYYLDEYRQTLDDENRLVLHGFCRYETLFYFTKNVWRGEKDFPPVEIQSGTVLPAGTYASFTYMVVPTPTSTPTPRPTSTPIPLEPSPTPTPEPTITPTVTPTLAPVPTLSPTPVPAPTHTLAPTPATRAWVDTPPAIYEEPDFIPSP
jgi:hypothetical protein